MKKTMMVMILSLFAFNACANDSGKATALENGTAINASKTLVAYFSCTGTTEKIAVSISNTANATIHKINPKIPYTADDLKYYTDCRADKEQADSTCRPKISNKIENFEKYDVIFLGYPIWHGQAPKIIYTFLESYDFSGKTIIPFCTSHSSGIGSSDTNLHNSAKKANWKSGKRFSGSASKKEISSWVEGLEIGKFKILART